MSDLPESEYGKVKKANRIRKKNPKKHRIEKVSGDSTKKLWRHIIERSQKLKK